MSYFGIPLRNGLGLGLGTTPSLTNAPLSYRLAPTLNLQFAGAGTLDPRITFTRSTTATFVNSSGVLSTAAINAARLDYNPATLVPNGLLIEENRVNSATYSEDFLNTATAGSTRPWTWTRATVSPNTTTAPDNTATADTLIEDTTASSTHLVFSNFATVSGTTYTYSVFAKAKERSQILLLLNPTGYGVGQFVYYDLIAGTATLGGGTPTFSITNFGNGWYRCTITATATATAASAPHFIQLAVGGTNIYTGNGTSGLYIWGAQFETGAFPTSYIPTVASQVTRTPDTITITGTNFSGWYNATEGTIFVGVVYNGQLIGVAGATNSIVLDDGTTSNRFIIRTVRDPSTPQADVNVISGGANQMDSGGFIPTVANTIYNRAIAYALNNAIPCVNGVLDGVTDTSFIVPVGVNRFAILTANCALYLRELTFYPRRLSDAELQVITT